MLPMVIGVGGSASGSALAEAENFEAGGDEIRGLRRGLVLHPQKRTSPAAKAREGFAVDGRPGHAADGLLVVAGEVADGDLDRFGPGLLRRVDRAAVDRAAVPADGPALVAGAPLRGIAAAVDLAHDLRRADLLLLAADLARDLVDQRAPGDGEFPNPRARLALLELQAANRPGVGTAGRRVGLWDGGQDRRADGPFVQAAGPGDRPILGDRGLRELAAGIVGENEHLGLGAWGLGLGAWGLGLRSQDLRPKTSLGDGQRGEQHLLAVRAESRWAAFSISAR